MFAAQHDNPPSLRQGDIVADVFFPLTRPALLRYLATFASGTDVNLKLDPFVEAPNNARRSYAQAVSHGVVGHGAVISQCCDLDRTHPKNSFSLCRLVPLDIKRFKNAHALIQNIDPWGTEKAHLQFFYLGQVDGLLGEYIADFALLTSFAWADYDLILGKKIHQLDDVNRNKFRVKVGAFFGRPAPEDVVAGLTNPWLPGPPVTPPSLFERIRSIFQR